MATSARTKSWDSRPAVQLGCFNGRADCVSGAIVLQMAAYQRGARSVPRHVGQLQRGFSSTSSRFVGPGSSATEVL